jgi:hypothetical protein
MELGGPHHGPRDGATLDQLLLAELARVVAGGYAVDADNRQRDVVAHRGGGFCGQQAAGDRAEELDGPGPAQRLAVGHVDHGVGAVQHAIQAGPGQQVDAG